MSLVTGSPLGSGNAKKVYILMVRPIFFIKITTNPLCLIPMLMGIIGD